MAPAVDLPLTTPFAHHWWFESCSSKIVNLKFTASSSIVLSVVYYSSSIVFFSRFVFLIVSCLCGLRRPSLVRLAIRAL